jgi:hypothetical protein
MKALYIKPLAMAVLTLAISSAAKAQKTSDIINRGDDFLAVCQYDNDHPPDVCLAYVAGVVGTLALNWAEQKSIFLVAQVTIKKYVCEAPNQHTATAPKAESEPKARP